MLGVPLDLPFRFLLESQVIRLDLSFFCLLRFIIRVLTEH